MQRPGTLRSHCFRVTLHQTVVRASAATRRAPAQGSIPVRDMVRPLGPKRMDGSGCTAGAGCLVQTATDGVRPTAPTSATTGRLTPEMGHGSGKVVVNETGQGAFTVEGAELTD